MANLQSKKNRRRKNKGFTLVEALTTIVIGTLISGIFLDFFGKLLRTHTATPNEICANAILNNLAEHNRALGFQYFNQKIGQTFTLSSDLLHTEHKTDGLFPMHEDAILLDQTNLDWNEKSRKSKFRGSVTYSITDAATTSGAILVTVRVKWSDNSKLERTISSAQIFTRNGLSKWSSN